MTKQPIPVRPALSPPEDRVRKAGQALARAAFCETLGKMRNDNPLKIYRELFSDDRAGILLGRAAIDGAKLSVDGWAGLLGGTAVADFFASLGGLSAVARLIPRGVRVTLEGGVKIVKFPRRPGGPVAFSWVGEGLEIPVRAETLDLVQLGPARKLGAIVVFSQELARQSKAATIFETMLREDAALSIDSAFFATTAGSASAHAGLLNGETPITASTAGGKTAMTEDLSALATAVAVGGSGQIVFVTGPGRAASLPILFPEFRGEVLPSPGVGEDRIIAIDPLSLATAFGAEPEFISSKETTLHMDDAPTAIGTAGAPPVVSAPVVGLFQTGGIATRVLCDVAFAKRRAGAVSFIDGMDWAPVSP